MNAYKKSKAFHPQQQHPDKNEDVSSNTAKNGMDEDVSSNTAKNGMDEDVSSNTAKNDVDELQKLMKKLNMWAGIEASSTSAGDVGNASMPPTSAEKNVYSRWINGTGGQKQQRGNKKNKPKIYKNKIILGKERGIYKIPGSRKDYIKYKGEFIAVNDYIKLKNK
jgi:hypothetical protein